MSTALALAMLIQAAGTNQASPLVAMDGVILSRVDATHVMVHSSRWNPLHAGPDNPGTHWILEDSTWFEGVAEPGVWPPSWRVRPDPTPWGAGFVIVRQTGVAGIYRVYSR